MNVRWAYGRRQSPVECRGCLFAAAGLLLIALAIWAASARFTGIGWAAAALGALSGAVWFYHIYLQSLHNTAM